MISWLITEYSPLVCLPMNFKVRCEVEVLTDGLGKVRRVIVVRGCVQQPILPDSFEFQDDILAVQDHQIDIVEAFPDKVDVEIQLPLAQRRAGWHQGDIKVAFPVSLLGCLRANKVGFANFRVAAENL
jgi:hypothetical protein